MDEKIITDIKTSFGMSLSAITAINGGWMNKLWKASAGDRAILIKQYSRKRFSDRQLDRIESALQRQTVLETLGVACPHIYRCGGQIIRRLPDGTAYMIMSFCRGKNENAETISPAQMRSLGNACGYMHLSFSRLQGQVEKALPASEGYTLDSLWRNFNMQISQLSDAMPETYREALLSCKPVLEQLTPDFFDRLPKGIAHEDFTPDNVLFHENGVEALIDFDRNCYSFLWHDVGQAVLSFALEKDRLNPGKIRAFAEGYSQHMPLSMADIADALRITWCIEAPWWIQPGCFTSSFNGKAAAYRDQILWHTRHWDELNQLFPLFL